MTRTLPTIAECDAQLVAAHTAYVQAVERGDDVAAELLYADLDELLELRLRLHLPRQR